MTALERTPDFSVILTCYREGQSIREFHRRLTATMISLGRPYEVILTNDGSPDDTLEVMEDIYDQDVNTRVLIDFCQNAGQAAGQTAGILESRGRALIFIDTDLQLDPEDIPKLVMCFDEGADMVGGCRTARNDPPFRKVASRLANTIIGNILRNGMRDIFCCFKIVRADIVRSCGYSPRRLFHVLEVMRRCRISAEVRVNQHPRPHGRSGWPLPRLFASMLVAVFVSAGDPFRMVSRESAAPKYEVRRIRRKGP